MCVAMDAGGLAFHKEGRDPSEEILHCISKLGDVHRALVTKTYPAVLEKTH